MRERARYRFWIVFSLLFAGWSVYWIGADLPHVPTSWLARLAVGVQFGLLLGQLWMAGVWWERLRTTKGDGDG